MAPFKFENKFREKLEQRTITPSESAWDRLDNRLDKRKSKNRFGWLGLAASIVGVIIVSFNRNNNSIEPVVVDTKDKVEIQPKLNGHFNNPETLTEVSVIKKVKTSSDNHSSAEEYVKQIEINSVKKENTEVVENNIKRPASYNVNQKANPNKEVASINNELAIAHFETQKMKEVVAQIQELKENNSIVTNAEVEALLTKAEDDIYRKRVQENVRTTIDANSLLSEVENELEESFRDRVFKKIKSSYKTVRTAVVERKNN